MSSRRHRPSERMRLPAAPRASEAPEKYCTRCQIDGAPSFHDFDLQFGIKAVSEHIDETTAAKTMRSGMP